MCQAIVPSVVRCHKVIRLVPAIEVYLPVQIFMYSTILELNCWILGDSPKYVFPVNIESASTVSHRKLSRIGHKIDLVTLMLMCFAYGR